MGSSARSVLIWVVILLLFAAFLVLSRWFFKRGWPQRIALSGLPLPLLTGICVRQYLQTQGKPVESWTWILGWFYHPAQLVALILILAYWDTPFLFIAALAGKRELAINRLRILVNCGFAGTFVISVLVFADLWRNVEAVAIAFPIIPLYVMPGTLLGLGAGWLLGRLCRIESPG